MLAGLCSLTGFAAVLDVLHALVRACDALDIGQAIVVLSLDLPSDRRYEIRLLQACVLDQSSETVRISFVLSLAVQPPAVRRFRWYEHPFIARRRRCF